jgi:hypothetical protein
MTLDQCQVAGYATGSPAPPDKQSLRVWELKRGGQWLSAGQSRGRNVLIYASQLGNSADEEHKRGCAPLRRGDQIARWPWQPVEWRSGT